MSNTTPPDRRALIVHTPRPSPAGRVYTERTRDGWSRSYVLTPEGGWMLVAPDVLNAALVELARKFEQRPLEPLEG